MSESWYYADAANQQKGPVPVDVLRYLHGRGDVNASTLVWRAGLAGWEPLAKHAAALGIGAAPASAAPRAAAAAPAAARVATPAGRPVVVRPSSGGGSGWVIAVVVLFVGIMVLGILAAIAIPAYSDYTMRAKVAQAINEATYLKVVVSEYVLTNDKCPANGDADIDSPESYASDTLEAIRVGQDESTGECVIQLVFKQLGTAEAGSEIVLTRGESGDWRATSTLPDRVLPASMRR